ncbi:E3 ubiquitin-protein ligase E3D-like isoform X2 [Apostichopus japonicus]|uniref:E3 ubiquitin-protein ligase E3D-like isoform X2 n=1 Tax=Stichopus japonicus TaxID=307972 RepID=UPI003AB3113D
MMFGEVRTAIETVELVISENVFQKWAELPHTQCKEEGNDYKRDLQSFNLKVTPGQVTVSNACHTTKTIYLLPSNVQLVPSAYSTVDWVKGDGLHLRCKVSCSRSDVASVNGDNMANLGQIETDCNNVFLICKSCGQQLTRKIKRISPLPSDDWDGISEELWCCRSKDVAGVPPDLKMSPNREECLSGNFEYILSIPQFLEQSVVFCDKDSARSGKKVLHKIVKKVECSRCHSSIGNSLRVGKTDSISLWKFQTALVTDDINLSRLNLSNSLEQLVSSYIYNQSRSHPTFKFMLENEDHDAQILLWLISPDSLLLRTGSDQAMGMGVGVASTVLNIHSVSIMKLLYQTCWDEKGKSMKDEWSRDMMVHSFTLPTKACYQLSDILVQSTRNTPPSMRRMNGLLIGYLKTS